GAGGAKRENGWGAGDDGQARAQDRLAARPRRSRDSAHEGRHSGTYSLGLSLPRGAGAGRRLDFGAARQRRISGGRRGHGKSVAMTARFQPGTAERDLLAAIRRAVRQEQFLEVVSADEARTRFTGHIDLAPLPRDPLHLP